MSNFESKLDLINSVAANIKKLIPSINLDAATEAAAVLVEAADNATDFEQLDTDALIGIKGIGTKRAEVILLNKLALIGKLVKLGEYSAAKKPSSPNINRKKVSFNQKWDPYKEPQSKMFVVEDTKVVEGELARWAKRNGLNPEEDMFVFCSYIEGSENPDTKSARVIQQMAAWKSIVTNGFLRGGRRYIACIHGPNAGKRDETLFIVEDAVDEARQFATMGTWLKGKNTAAKQIGYAGLSIGGTTPLSAWIGGIEISPRNVLVIESFNKMFKDVPVDFVDPATGEVTLDVRRDVKLNVSDGYGQMHLSNALITKLTTMLSPEARLQVIRAIKEMPSFTIRGGGNKGLIDTHVDFHQWFKDHGITELKDKWGRMLKVDDIALIIDDSVLKLKIGKDGQFATYEEYCDAFEAYGHSYQVMLVEHSDKKHNLPFQQLQSLVGAEAETFKPAMESEIAKLNSYQNTTNAAKLIGSDLGRIIANVPEMHHLPYIQKQEQNAYDKRVREAKGGVVHGIAHSSFCAPDPEAFLEWSAYRDESKVKGCIAANSASCSYLEEDEAVISRNPSTDSQAQCVVKVVKMGNFAKYVKPSTLCYLSIHSLEVMRVRGDYDGDHLCITENKAIVAMAKEANAVWGGRLIDWEDVTSGKDFLTEEDITNYFVSLTKVSQLGHFCDQLTSLVGFGAKGYDHKVACWLVMAVNVFVDASKHGMGDVLIPDYVQDFLTVHDQDGNVVRDDDGNPVIRPMPIYAMQAKDNHRPNAITKKVGSKRCATRYGAGFGDVMAFGVQKECKPNLELDLTGISQFNVNDLLFDYTGARNGGKTFGLRGCEALFADGKYNEETGKYENEGLWKKLCFGRGHFLKELHAGATNEDKYVQAAITKNFKIQNRVLAIKLLTEWAKAHDMTIEDVCDAATFQTWCKLRFPTKKAGETEEKFAKRMVAYDMQIEAWTDIFGGMVQRAIFNRQTYLAAGGEIATFEDGLDETTDELW